MSKNVFMDMLVASPTILDSKDDGKLRVRFKATQANVVNSNMRLYPGNVLADAVNESNKLVEQSRMVGESPHPKHFVGKDGVVFDTKIENTVIKIYNQFIDSDGSVYVDAEVLDTAKGKDLKALIDAGIPVGISMRALGDSVKKQISKVMVDVATRLDIKSYDVVMNPATAGCEVVSVLTDSQIEEVLADDVQITIPACPSCGVQLTAQDPDGDGDLDFYSCGACKEVYIPEEEKTIAVRASQVLRKLPNDPDYDGYSLARQYKASLVKGMTDSTNKKLGDDSEAMTIEEILKAMQDSPEFKAIVDAAAEAKAQQIAQPALDAINAQNAATEAAKVTDAAKTEAKAFVDGRLAELKGKVADEVLTVIADQVKDASDKTTAAAVIDGVVSVYSKTSSHAKLDSLGFNNTSGEGGHVRVEVGHEPKPWAQGVKKILDSFDHYGETFGHTPDQSIRKANEKVVADLINRFEQVVGYEAMKDSATMLDSFVATDSVSVTTAQLLNQPSIQQALIIQAFQDVESLQFLAAETFEGSEVRWPVETFTSAGTINPASGQSDILVGEGVGIPESAINLAWLTYNPSWRRNAISVTTDVERQLKTGPARYDAISRGVYHIAFDKRRKLDNLAYLEMVMASDEYAPNVITSEVAVAGNVTAVSNGTNVVYKYNATLKGTATATAGTNPIVRPRTRTQILPSGQTQTVTANPVSVTVGGSPLVQGYLDANNNVAGASATYAIDYENGIWYFTSGAGLNPAAGTPIVPTLNYSAVTNYDRWSYTVPGTVKAEDYYNGLLQLITKEVQLMGSAPRFNKPNLGIMSLNASQYIENASMWYKLNSPDLGGLTGGGTSTAFGHRSGVNLNRINAPWVAGDNRILLTQKGATRYAIETPYQIEGPYPKFDANQQIVDAKLFYGRENSVMATPQTIDTNGNVINPKSRSIKLVP